MRKNATAQSQTNKALRDGNRREKTMKKKDGAGKEDEETVNVKSSSPHKR